MSKYDHLDAKYEKFPKRQKMLKSARSLGRPLTDTTVGNIQRQNRARRKLKELGLS